MNVELSDKEVNEIISLIDQAWCDGFESEELNSIFEKLNSPKEITSDRIRPITHPDIRGVSDDC
ncbi:hypothetical protein [Serratia symbiotica]|uniref:Uncharacterized protein n=1 Tax=Serratia symbiotica TaxID=138074 RepID=A0A068Z0C1_9GAMM|nr:hypothetical protein [Serratia symbiotica]QLH62287.1 hypothetical protein SYMBAF_04100 [Serratia symbiotica]CDS55676.1 hypothetical protein SYMBAF_100018 [Serratia symbiotica]